MSKNTINISLIRSDGGTQTRAMLNADTVDTYAEAMKEGTKFPPIKVFYDGTDYWLADGFHRLAAHKKNDEFRIAADVKQGTRREAILYAMGANITHGLPESRADKRRKVETLLRDPEWAAWSNREIARRSGVSDKTVAAVRAELSAEIPQMASQDSVTVSRGGVTFQQKINSNLRKGDRVEFPDKRRGIVQSIYDNGMFAAVMVNGKEENTLTTNLSKVKPVKLPFGGGQTLLYAGKVVVVWEINEEENFVTFLGDEKFTVSLEQAMNARPINDDVPEFNPDEQWDDLPDEPVAIPSENTDTDTNAAFAIGDRVYVDGKGQIGIIKKLPTAIGGHNRAYLVSREKEGAPGERNSHWIGESRLTFVQHKVSTEQDAADQSVTFINQRTGEEVDHTNHHLLEPGDTLIPAAIDDASAEIPQIDVERRPVAYNDTVITRTGHVGIVEQVNGNVVAVRGHSGYLTNHHPHHLIVVEDKSQLTDLQRDEINQIVARELKEYNATPQTAQQVNDHLEANPQPEPVRFEVEAAVYPKKGFFGTGYSLDHDLPNELQRYLDSYDLRKVQRVRLVLEVVEAEVQP